MSTQKKGQDQSHPSPDASKGDHKARQRHGVSRRRHSPARRGEDASGGGSNAPLISVVIPLLNEAESLRELGARLETVLASMAGERYEVVFIDDGSTDNSFEILREMHRNNPRFRAVRFRVNYGKSPALSIGLAQARGEIIFTMDADLQDDPAELPAMLKKLKEGGYDLVSGWKQKRYDPWHKTFPSKFFNFVVRTVTGLKIHDFNCGLKVYRRDVIPHLSIYGEMHRYLPAQAHWQGFRVTEHIVQHHPRKHGVSKYGMSRFVKGFLDLLTLVLTTRYAQRPLHVFGTVGVVIATVGFLIDLWLTVEWFLGTTSLTNRPLALLGVLLIIVGVQLISIGLIGEMIAKNSLNNKQYSIRETLQ